MKPLEFTKSGILIVGHKRTMPLWVRRLACSVTLGATLLAPSAIRSYSQLPAETPAKIWREPSPKPLPGQPKVIRTWRLYPDGTVYLATAYLFPPTSSPWTVPTSNTLTTIECYGGGGGGGSNVNGFLGGGGGAYQKISNSSVSGTVITVSVGTTGNYATANGGNNYSYSTNGGSTTVTISGSQVAGANGGEGGDQGGAGASAPATGTIKFGGGSSTGGSTPGTGHGGGGCAGNGSNGGSTNSQTAGTAGTDSNSKAGPGGSGAQNGGSQPSAPSGVGGGGGAMDSSGNQNAGPGANGLVIITTTASGGGAKSSGLIMAA